MQDQTRDALVGRIFGPALARWAWARWWPAGDRDLRARGQRRARTRPAHQRSRDSRPWTARWWPGRARSAAAPVVRWLPPPREGAAGDDIAGLVLDERRRTERRRPAGRRPAPLGQRSGSSDSRAPAATGRSLGRQQLAGTGGRRPLQLDCRARRCGSSRDSVGARCLTTPPRVVGLIASAPLGERSGTATRSAPTGSAGLARDSGRASSGPAGAARSPQSELTILHLSDTQFGAHHLFGGNGPTPADRAEDTLFSRLHHDLAYLAADGLRPDLLVVTGDLAEWGLRSEFEQVASSSARCPRRPRSRGGTSPSCRATTTSTGRPARPISPSRRATSRPGRAVLAQVAPVRRHLRRILRRAAATFTPDEPWTLFEMPDLAVVVAGLNSTMAESHRDADHYGWSGNTSCGGSPTDWPTTGTGMVPAGRRAPQRRTRRGNGRREPARRRGPGPAPRPTGSGEPPAARAHSRREAALARSGLPVLSTGSAAVDAAARPAEVPNQYQLITVRRDGFTRHARQYAPGQRAGSATPGSAPTGSDWRDTHTCGFSNATPRRRPQAADADESAAEADGAGPAWPAAGAGRGPDPWADRRGDPGPLPRRHRHVRPEGGYLRVSSPLPGGGGSSSQLVYRRRPADREALELSSTRCTPGLPRPTRQCGRNSSTAVPRPGHLVLRARQRGVRLRSLIDYQGLLDLRPLGGQSELAATSSTRPPIRPAAVPGTGGSPTTRFVPG